MICKADQLTGFYMRVTLALNGLIIWISFARCAKFWDTWLDFRSCETSSSTDNSRSANNCEVMLVRMKWLSAPIDLVDIEFVKARKLLLWQTASAFIVCSVVRSTDNLENDFVVFLAKNSLSKVIVNYSICAPTFTSSDWSTHVFVIGYVTNVM